MLDYPQIFQQFKKEQALEKSEQASQKHDFSKLTLKETGQLLIKETLKKSKDLEKFSRLEMSLFTDWSSLQDSLPVFPRSKYDINKFPMKETQINDLKLTKNEGFYLTLKLLPETPVLPAHPSGVTVLVQDKNEDIVRVTFYNMVNFYEGVEGLVKSFGREYEKEEINIKHPYYMISEEDGLPLILVSGKDEFWKSSQISNKNGDEIDLQDLLEEMNEMKEEAKECLGGSDIEDLYDQAIGFYIVSAWKFINIPVPVLNQEDFLLDWKIFLSEDQRKQVLAQLAIVFSNCSYCYLKNNQPLFALHYAHFAIWSDPSFFKARLRAIEAKIELLHVEEALDELEGLKKAGEAEKFKKEIHDLNQQALQQRKNFASTATRAKFFSENFELKAGQTFIGPIELKQSNEKSRGFFAKRDIQKGETLLIDKGIADYGHGNDFICMLLERLEKNEDLKPFYMNLFPSKKSDISNTCLEEQNMKAKGMPIEAELNAYRFKRRFSQPYRYFTESEINMLAYKATFNSISLGKEAGLFPYFSYFNHSCAPNTCMYFSSDQIMVVAQNNIKKGEEIFVSYVPLSLNKLQRKEKLKMHDFECMCDRCQELGTWKEKEAFLTGIKCPKCQTAISISCEKRGFICPKDCFFLSEAQHETLLAKYLEMLAHCHYLFQSESKDCLETLEFFLKMIEERFFWPYSTRANLLCSLAEYYAVEENEKMFMKYFGEIIKIIEYFPNPELRVLLNNLISRMNGNLGKRPSKEQLKHFEYFGLSLETCVKLEEAWFQHPNQVTFLPMSSLMSEEKSSQQDLDIFNFMY